MNTEQKNLYSLPKLPYDFRALEPHISERQLALHYQKHHQAYVNGANAILEKLEKARKENLEVNMKAVLKELSFNVGGHVLHSLFWENLTPQSASRPSDFLSKILDDEFGSVDQFKKEFSQAALTAEGSGWAALTYCTKTQRPMIMQIEKHNVNIYPSFEILAVLDVWEHAYYLDYKNERAKFIDAFWNIINWEKVAERLKSILQ